MTLPTINEPSVISARHALCHRLRELRRRAGLSGRRLADLLGWAPSKVSKIENGRQSPSPEDIRRWARATGDEHETEALLAAADTAEFQYTEWRHLLRGGFHGLETARADLDARTRITRVYAADLIPDLLQTGDYAHARFLDHPFPAADVTAGLTARVERQRILYSPTHRFHVLLSEAALRCRACPPEVMLGQLDRLLAITALPTVRLGVIEFSRERLTTPRHGFALYDNGRVLVETITAVLDLRQPSEIETYGTVFNRLAAAAEHGAGARSIISRVIDDQWRRRPA